MCSVGQSPHLHVIADSLERMYGRPQSDPLPLGNRPDPLDELVYIMLTVMTEFGVEGVYQRLRETYVTWQAVVDAPTSAIAAVLQPIGLSQQRAHRIHVLLAEIAKREDALNLDRLYSLNDAETEAYLATLPGVGKKIARCVMLYSLGRDVFPVDTHVLRVLKRLGFAEEALSLQRAQDALQTAVPASLRYTLHVNLVVHGRTVCRARAPRCGDCVLAEQCPSARS